MSFDCNPSPRLQLFRPLRRLVRLLLIFGTLLFALSTQAAWDKPPYPVIFIHGLNSSADDAWGDFKKVLEDKGNGWVYGGTFTHDYLKNLIFSKDQNTFVPVSAADFYTLTFSSNQDLTFSQQGQELADVISAVVAVNKAADPTRNKVILVGHSMGGLAARAYLQGQTGIPFRNDVDALITVGTPHQGSWETQHCVKHPYLCRIGPALKGGTQLRADSVSMNNLRPDSQALIGLQGLNTAIGLPSGRLPPSISRYISIVVGWKRGNTLTGIDPDQWGEDGDGIVTTSSQDLSQVPGFTEGTKHSKLDVEFEVNPDCGTQKNFARPSVNLYVYVNEVHTCETHDLRVQNNIVRSILGKSPSIVTTGGAIVTVNSPPQIILQGTTSHLTGVTNPHFLYGTTSSSLLNSSNGTLPQSSTTTSGVQKFSAVLPGTLVPGQTYYYQLVAEADGYTTYGQVQEVTVPPVGGIGTLLPAPTGLSPATGAIDQTLTPTLTWNTVASATSYRIMLAQNPVALPTDSTDGNCDRCLVDKVVTSTSYSPPTDALTSGTTYYWQVHARSPTNFGTWSAASSFTTATPTPATLLTAPAPSSPADNTSGLSGTPTLSWSQTSNATSYRIMIAPTAAALTADPTSADCATCVVDTIVSGGTSTSYIPDSGVLTAGTTYYWRIKARSPDSYGTWSAARSFTVSATAAVTGSVTPMISAHLSYRTCALTSSGGVKCWGDNYYGQLGDGSTTQRLTPVDVVGLTSGVTAIAVGTWHTCALTISGGVKCWGQNSTGQLGDNSRTQRLTPVDVVGLTSGVTAISVGGSYTCALTSAGGVKCWGSNVNNEFDANGLTFRLIPNDISGLTSGVTAISAGYYHTCALTSGGGVKCWGYNYAGALGNAGTSSNQWVPPVNIVGLTSGVSAISAGWMHNCALTSGGSVKCWGLNDTGQLGDNSRTNRLTPVDVVGLTSGVIAIQAGSRSSCALTSGGGVKCWGWNSTGELGDDSVTIRLTPVDVSGLSNGVSAIAAGDLHACALTSDGGVKCWGYDQSGELGDNSITISRRIPVQVLGTNAVGYLNLGTVPTSYSLSVSSGNGTVTSVPAGINCGTACTANFALGTNVTLTATPNAGSSFNGWSGGGCYGTGTCQLTMNATTGVNAAFGSITVPDPPTVTGITFGHGSVTLDFIAPANNGGSAITGYTATCTAAGGATGTQTGTATPLTVTGLTYGMDYSCTIAASNSTGTSASPTVLAAAPLASTIDLAAGWNLVGNSFDTTLDVASAFGDATKVTSVWKWVTSGTRPNITYPTWAFYSPGQNAGGQAFATSKGYDFLTTLNAGEGFWVDAKAAFKVQLISGNAVSTTSFRGMTPGWHLISIGDAKTASGFNADMSISPPTAGVVQQNVKSLWAWDNAQSKWYFYSSRLEAQGGTALTDYITGMHYLDLNSTNNALRQGVGFWVNMP